MFCVPVQWYRTVPLMKSEWAFRIRFVCLTWICYIGGEGGVSCPEWGGNLRKALVVLGWSCKWAYMPAQCSQDQALFISTSIEEVCRSVWEHGCKGFCLNFTEMIIGLLYSATSACVYQVTFASIANSPALQAGLWASLLSYCEWQFALNPLKCIQGSFAPHWSLLLLGGNWDCCSSICLSFRLHDGPAGSAAAAWAACAYS